jgi:hypothetical protein
MVAALIVIGVVVVVVLAAAGLWIVVSVKAASRDS